MKGFYFGGSFIDKASLRSSILYYDFIIHYDVAKFFGSSFGSQPIKSAIDDFYKDTKLFVDEGLLRLIPLKAWTNRYTEVFRYIVTAKFFDEKDFLLANVLRLSEIRRLIVIHTYGKSIKTPELNPHDFGFYTHYAENNPFTDTPPEIPYWYENHVVQAIGREVTYGLLGGVEFDAIPFSDVSFYTDTLAWLVRKLANLDSGVALAGIPEIRSKIVSEALSLVVPSFENIPDEELLEFRMKRTDELFAFRTAIDEITEEIQVSELSDTTLEKLQIGIRSKLRPRIKELEKTVDEKVAELRKKRFENVTASSISLLGFTLLPFEAAILPTLMVIGKWTSDEIGSLLDRMKIKRNGLYLLWDLQKKSLPK